MLQILHDLMMAHVKNQDTPHEQKIFCNSDIPRFVSTQ
jgi:hypothetical protein